MLTIIKDGEVIAQAKDDRLTFTPDYESEKYKEPSLFVLTEQDENRREGLTDGSRYS